MSEEREIKAAIPTYYSFIITGLTEIRELWAVGKTVRALKYAFLLSTFLPPSIKKEISPERVRVQNLIEKTYENKGYCFNTIWQYSEIALQKIANAEIEPFLDKFVNLLDNNNLLTQQYGVPTRKGSLENIGRALQ